MTLKQRIWLLPAIAMLASVLSIGAHYLLTSSASQLLADVQSDDYPAVNYANAMLATVASLEERLQNAVAAGDKAVLGSLDEKAVAFRAVANELAKLPGQSKASEQLRDQFNDYYSNASQAASIMLGMTQGDITAAVGSMQSTQVVLRKSLADFKQTAVANFEQELKASQNSIHNLLIAGMVEALLAVLAIGVACYLLIPSIMRPIQTAVGIAQAMARGDLSGEIEVQGRDEMAQLLGAMRDMVQSFNGFVAAQQKLTEEHSMGNVGYTIAAQEFPGIYGEMARSTNELARSQMAVTQRVLDVVARYAVGDLSVEMDSLPGEQMKIKVACDGVKQSLEAINHEIARLVEAAARGDFRVRGDVEGFHFSYRQMVLALNRLMEEADGGLSEVAHMLAALARGDLTTKISNNYQGTFALLSNDATATVTKLTEIVQALQACADSTNAILGEKTSSAYAAGYHDSTLQATAAALEELTATVKHNAEGAAQATQLATATRTLAEQGGGIATRAMQAVEEINHSSRRIGDIIGVIDGIAFQTNLLALNAAVEAARAGEQGRGFAVVASEVRSLAGRSKAAAKEIKDLIADSARKVENGSQLVNESGRKLAEIVESVKKVSDIVCEIAAASRQQAQGIGQVNQAMMEMDRILQENARDLAAAVAQFKIGRTADELPPQAVPLADNDDAVGALQNFRN